MSEISFPLYILDSNDLPIDYEVHGTAPVTASTTIYETFVRDFPPEFDQSKPCDLIISVSGSLLTLTPNSSNPLSRVLTVTILGNTGSMINADSMSIANEMAVADNEVAYFSRTLAYSNFKPNRGIRISMQCINVHANYTGQFSSISILLRQRGTTGPKVIDIGKRTSALKASTAYTRLS